MDTNDELVPRLTLTYGLADDLNVFLRYSLLESSTSESISDHNGVMDSTLIHSDSEADLYDGDISDASIKLDMDLSTLDIGLVKGFKISDNFSTELAFGFRQFNLNRNIEARYYDALGGGGDISIVNQDLKTEGQGLRIGVGANVDLGGGFGAYGNTAISLLKARSKQKHVENEPDDSETNVDIRQTDDHSVTSLEMGVGATWTKDLAGGNLSVKLGYELTTYDGLYMTEFPDDVNDGATARDDLDISTSGWVLGVSYTF